MRSAKMPQFKTKHYVVSLCLALSLFIGSLNAECCTDGETEIDPDDCTKYRVCCHGEFVSKSCKDGYYWNSDTEVCAVDNGVCKPPSCVDGEMEGNPEDCAGYLECVNGTVVSKSCPDGYYFDETKCVLDTCGICVNCTEGTKVADLDDCTKYKLCSNGKYVSQSCEAGFYWNSNKTKCEKDDGQCNGSPSCTDGEVECDPKDCAGYLVCTNGSLVSQKCAEGYYFNNKTLTCILDTNGTCVNCTEGSTKPEPSGDCTKYQVCSGGKYVTMSCSDGQYWNSTWKQCQDDTDGVCINCTEGSTKPEPSGDCTKYQVCSGGKYVTMSCPDDQYWNSTYKKCLKDNGECNGSPSCTDGEVECDPKDCAGYLVCTNGSLVSQKCAEGYYFNNKTLTCILDTNGTCVNCTEGSTKPEPSGDCTKYQVCSGGKYVTMSCSDGQYWNSTWKQCQDDTDGVCINCTEGSTKPEPSGDCTKYQVCSGGKYVTMSCSDGQYWNSTWKQCQDDTDGVCINCTEGSTKPEPSGDCTKYQICSGGKYVTMSCPDGQYWNSNYTKCLKDNGECNGTPSCPEGNITANPADCAGYMQCVNGQYVARKCSATEFFNTTLNKCVVDRDGVCIPKTCDPQCCDLPNYSMGSVEKNCSAFFQCVNGKYVQQRCPNNLQFNNITGDCDYPENVDCDDGTAPPSGPSAGPSGTYCENQGRCVGERDGAMLASDKSTCSSSYVVCQCECEVAFSCSAGLIYNEKLKTCDWPSNVKC